MSWIQAFGCKVVIDTNVFISGIFWSGPPYRILKAWNDKEIELMISLEILDEYKRVFEYLSYKYSPVDWIDIIELVIRDAHFYEPVFLLEQISKDPDDDKFIACAIAAHANFIITGDDDLLSLNEFAGIKMIKPADFVRNNILH